MKLVFVIDSLGVGGKERRCLQLIKGLNARGITDIHLVLIDNIIGYHYVNDLNVTLYCLNRKSPKDLSVLVKLIHIIRDLNPEIVLSWSIMSSFWLNIIHVFINFNYISAFVASSNKVHFFSIINFVKNLSIISSKFIVGNSMKGLKEFSVPTSKSRLIYNGFDNDRLNKVSDVDQIKKKYNLKTRYVVTMAGRVCNDKDFHTYIEAARLILKERSDTTFLAIGEGPQLKNYINSLKSNETRSIIFTGNIIQIDNLINVSDICVLCSNHNEGISNFILESMAFGKPIIATNNGGTPEIVENNVTGFLISPKDINDLKDKINILLDSKENREIFGKAAIEVVQNKFSLERMCDEFYNLFQEISKK